VRASRARSDPRDGPVCGIFGWRVETRLQPYPELVRAGRLPAESPLELAIDRWSPEMWDPNAPLTDLGDEDEDGFEDVDELLEGEDEDEDENELIDI
jgi:hypothetical protein